jgi:hypothetical protein
MDKVIYLGVMIGFLFVVRALFIRMEERAKYRNKMETKRRNARFYETIDYTNFNKETGKYEN